jgi:enterochelin esterase family protein
MQLSPTFPLFSLLFFLAAFCAAQQDKSSSPSSPPAPLISPDVHADGSVTFRFRAPNAKEVSLAREGAEPQAMVQNDQAIWSLTTAPLAPDYYSYSFVADGVRLIDPSNPLITPNLLSTASAVHVPGPPSLPWEVKDIPHGEIPSSLLQVFGG